MAVIVSDSGNASYDGNLATANGFYRAEAWNVGCHSATALLASTARAINVTFANAGNCEGVVLALLCASVPTTDRDLTVRLQEAKTVGSFTTSTERVNITGHGLTDGTPISFTSTGTLPTGISTNAIYYVINATANDFQTSTTLGGSVNLLSGTPTGTATCWADRASLLQTKVQMFGTQTGPGRESRNYLQGFVPFDFATPYAVDTAANKWRFHVFQSGGTAGNWYLLTSDATNAFYVAWCDNKVSHTDGDVMIVKDKIIINKTFSLSGILGTGATDRSTCGVICRNSDYSIANVALLEWENPATAPYTMTINGDILLGTHSGFRVGTSASPISKTNQATITCGTPSLGTQANSKFFSPLGSLNTSFYAGMSSIFFYGEVPALQKTTLSADALTGQAIIKTTDSPASWQANDYISVGRQDVVGQGSTVIHQVSSVSGSDVTLTANLATANRLTGGAVINHSRAGILIQGNPGANIGAILLDRPSNLIVKGVDIVDFRLTIGVGNAYEGMDDATYRSQYLFEDCTVRSTSTTNNGLIATLFLPKDGAKMNRCYVFRGMLVTTISGYANANLKSGYFEADNCVCSANYQTSNFAPSSTSKINIQNCSFENSARYGGSISGIGTIFKNNTFWGILATSSSDYYALLINQMANSVDIGGNTFDKCGTALQFATAPTINCFSVGDRFGEYAANTTDIKIAAGAIIDFRMGDTYAQSGSLVIDLVNLADVIPGSKLRFTDVQEVANADKVYTPGGTFYRTGYDLADTTVWTGSTFGAAIAGQFALKCVPLDTASELLSYAQEKTTGDISGKTMIVTARVKIDNANYYAGTYTAPTLRVVYDGGTEVTSVATASTSAQQLLVSFTPTTGAQAISIYIEGATDAIEADAAFYVGEIVAGLPEGVSIDTTRFGLWNNALPLPTISTIPVPASVWDEAGNSHTVSGTMGEKLNKALSTAKFLALK